MSTKTEFEELIEVGVMSQPLALLAIKDQNLRFKIDSYLPYSVGIEIECAMSSNFNSRNFKDIPYIMDVNCDSCEQRFRIPNGLCGLICLFNICDQLRLNSELNPDSGIHYHIDMSKSYKALTDDKIKDNEDWILKELDTWEYKGSYNKRQVTRSRTWVRIHEYNKTAEFRIGEMSFDYKVLAKRIIHANKIVKALNKNIGAYTEVYEYPTIDPVLLQEQMARNEGNTIDRLTYLLNKLASLNDGRVEIDFNTMKQTIKNRIVKI